MTLSNTKTDISHT